MAVRVSFRTNQAMPGQGRIVRRFPKARVVALAECGTHAFLAAEVAGYSIGEKTLANRLYPRLNPDELLTMDRNFYSFDARAPAGGAALLWRAPTQLELPVGHSELDPECAHLVRVVEYDVPDGKTTQPGS